MSTRRPLPWLLAGAALSWLLVLGWLLSRESWQPARALLASRGTGWAALTGLLACLCVSPLERLARALGARLPPGAALRRGLGMTSAWLALLHASASLGLRLEGSWLPVWSVLRLRAGLLALGVLLLLLLTSYPRLVRLMGVARTWKELHRLSYLAALLAFLHVLLSPFASRHTTLALLLAVTLVGLLRLIPRGAGPTPLPGADSPQT